MKNLLAIIILVTFLAPAWAANQNNCKGTKETEWSINGTPQRILLPNPNRKCLLIQNKNVFTAYVKETSAQTTSQEGIAVYSTGNWEPYIVPTNALYAQTAGSSTTNIIVIEGE